MQKPVVMSARLHAPMLWHGSRASSALERYMAYKQSRNESITPLRLCLCGYPAEDYFLFSSTQRRAFTNASIQGVTSSLRRRSAG